MKKQNDGGPAFPIHPDIRFTKQTGMSLRDYFAAAAIPGLIQHESSRCPNDDLTVRHDVENWDDLANTAFAIADSMLDVKRLEGGQS
jgi:hypothetical protein